MHAFTVLAHAGHPGPETHGLLTHLVVGLLIALPLTLGALRAVNYRKQATAPVKTPQ